MSAHEKSLFGLFKKKSADTPIIPAEPPVFTAVEDEQAPALAPSIEEETVKAYTYTSSWQRSADDETDKAAREDVINVHNVVGKLDEIFHSAHDVQSIPEEDTKPACLSLSAADKFAQALVGEPTTAEAAAQHPPLPEHNSNGMRFSERLKRQVESRINQEASMLQPSHETVA
jgi:hypothetical protein